MEVHFTPEQEAQLAQMATNAGTDVERLVKEAALRLLAGNGGQSAAQKPTRNPLPVWHLGGAIGSLHRATSTTMLVEPGIGRGRLLEAT